jgi:Fe2+ or Zn2+ uptake regulation protein
MKEEDKKMLNKAIDSLGMYTENQSKVLCELVNSAVDNTVYIPVAKINQKTGVTRPTVYAALNKLMIDGVIQQDRQKKGVFTINQDKIDFIIKSYKKQT